jgi:eukaryotic-like serine/threonine-protein kinase
MSRTGEQVVSLASRRPAKAEEARYAPGEVIQGKYRLESILGQGGMGAVWLARNLTLDVDVALKLIHADVASPIASQRLLVEARSAAKLEHASIVRVFDFGATEHGDPFIVMEVVRGESLGDVLERKGRLPAPMAVQLLLPIVDALSVAHGRGIIHRDVKPDNIILMTGDNGAITPKLVDFGIAKDVPHDPSAIVVADKRSRRPLTQVGIVVGSPEYMSPEQAMASSVDLRSDIWGLCIVLYEAICGTRPFGGEDFTKLAIAINIAEPQPITEHGAGDEALWRILAQGLKKNRDERWSSMRAMGCALAGWLMQKGVRTDVNGAALEAHWLGEAQATSLSAPPPAPARPSRLPALAAGGALVLALAVAWLLVDRGERHRYARDPRASQPVAGAMAPQAPTATANQDVDSDPEVSPAASATAATPARPMPHGTKREQAAPHDPGF